MTEQELKDALMELERTSPLKCDCAYHPYDRDGLHYDPFVRNPMCSFCFADAVVRLFEQAHYVRLADDQSLPEFPPVAKEQVMDAWVVMGESAMKKAQQDMLKAGFKKVETKEVK